MRGDFHVRFCERFGLKCPDLLDLTAEYLYSMICIFQKKVISLNPKVRQTNSGQSRTGLTVENRYCFVTYLKF